MEHTQNHKYTQEEKRLLARFPEESNNPIIRIGEDGTLRYMNRAAQFLLLAWKIPVGGRLPERFIEVIHQCLETDTCMTTGLEIEVEERRLVFTPILLDGADSLYLHGQDVTLWRQYEGHLKLLASVFENVIESIIVTDSQGVIEQVNPAFSAMNGFAPAEVIGKTPRIIRSDRHDAEFYRWMWSDINKKGLWKGRIWNRRKNGEVYPALLSISSITDKNGLTNHYCSICHDVTEKTLNDNSLRFEAYHDVLTGLPTKQLFYDRLDRAFLRAQRNNTMVAILVIALDGFKRINERFGYRFGDRMLQNVARRFRGVCRGDDTLARYSGDAFAMITGSPGGDPEYASLRAEQMIKSLSIPFDIQKNPIIVKASCGISVYPADAGDMHSLLENARVNLRSAKKRGGGQTVWQR